MELNNKGIIVLPKLEQIVFHETGNKNVIKHLICPEIHIPINIIETGRYSSLQQRKADAPKNRSQKR